MPLSSRLAAKELLRRRGPGARLGKFNDLLAGILTTQRVTLEQLQTVNA